MEDPDVDQSEHHNECDDSPVDPIKPRVRPWRQLPNGCSGKQYADWTENEPNHPADLSDRRPFRPRGGIVMRVRQVSISHCRSFINSWRPDQPTNLQRGIPVHPLRHGLCKANVPELKRWGKPTCEFVLEQRVRTRKNQHEHPSGSDGHVRYASMAILLPEMGNFDTIAHERRCMRTAVVPGISSSVVLHGISTVQSWVPPRTGTITELQWSDRHVFDSTNSRIRSTESSSHLASRRLGAKSWV